jgi:hypothetical protein
MAVPTHCQQTGQCAYERRWTWLCNAWRFVLTRCEDGARRWPLRFSLAASAVLFTGFFAVLEPSFQTNDDPQLAMIVSGSGTGVAADEHLFFSNVIIGQLLKALYGACSWLPWYGVYQYLIHYFAQAGILYCTMAAGYSRLRLALYLMYFASAELFFLNNLQFTITASVAVQCGLLLWLVAFRESFREGAWPAWKPLAGGMALPLIGSLVRLECFYLTLLVALPAFVCLLVRPRRGRVVMIALACGILCVGLAAGLAKYDRSYFANDARWRRFASYNEARVKFNDYEWIEYSPETAGVFASVGWSGNDFAMIRQWFYDDPQRYGEERLRRVIESYPWRSRRVTASYCWKAACRIVRDKSLWPVMLVAPLFFYCLQVTRRNVLSMVTTGATAAALLAYVSIAKKPVPNRIYLPVLTFPLALAMTMAREAVHLPRGRRPVLAWRCLATPWSWRRAGARVLVWPILTWTALVMACGGLAYGVGRQVRHSHKMNVARQELQRSFARLPRGDDRLYVFWAPGFPFEVLSPLDNLRWLKDLHLLLISWPQTTPINEELKRKFGINDTYAALFERPNVYFLGDPKCVALYRNYVREHYGVDVHLVTTYDGGHRYDLAGQFVRQTALEAANRRARVLAGRVCPDCPACRRLGRVIPTGRIIRKSPRRAVR